MGLRIVNPVRFYSAVGVMAALVAGGVVVAAGSGAGSTKLTTATSVARTTTTVAPAPTSTTTSTMTVPHPTTTARHAPTTMIHRQPTTTVPPAKESLHCQWDDRFSQASSSPGDKNRAFFTVKSAELANAHVHFTFEDSPYVSPPAQDAQADGSGTAHAEVIVAGREPDHTMTATATLGSKSCVSPPLTIHFSSN